MSRALIGHTGFVGSNLASQVEFDDHFNSKNIASIRGQTYERLTCAGVRAVKWKAIQEPEADRAQIESLANHLAHVKVEEFVLISTIDVYPSLVDMDEDHDCRTHKNNAYGTNRLWLEEFCRSHFSRALIVRLPGLFGAGLKKNVIFDLLNKHRLEAINPASSFQYYCLDNLWKDISASLNSGLSTVNFFTEPVHTSTIIERHFPNLDVGGDAPPEVHYDLTTRYAKTLRDRDSRYLYDAEEVLDQMANFVAKSNGERQ